MAKQETGSPATPHGPDPNRGLQPAGGIPEPSAKRRRALAGSSGCVRGATLIHGGARSHGLAVDLTPAQVIAAVQRMSVGERRAFIEDLLAATSPEYLAGIREARADRRAGRVKSLREVFRA